ncbi:MAG: FISUMP domain-containing protein [Prolixibacteraceae bacterium]
MTKFISMLILVFICSGNLWAQITGTFKDKRDGQIYKTIEIGDQLWMAENLRYRVNNVVEENVAIQEEVGFDFAQGYPESDKYKPEFGLYYTWKEANVACPAGWKLPSKTDWEKLFEEVGGKEIAGARLASRSEIWKEPFDPKIEACGFNIEPTGYRFYILYRLWEVGKRSFYWSSTELHEQSAIGFDFHAGYSEVFGGQLGYRKENATSVRCIKSTKEN